MSKYVPLWSRIAETGGERFLLSFAEAKEILGFPIDHSFLSAKKELLAYGFCIRKISMKEQTILVEKMNEKPAKE